jgi:hypothetical protein
MMCPVDIVLCVDVTMSMSPTLTNVKHSALSFPARLSAGGGRPRLKVIGFRDFGDWADDAISESPFYGVPDEIEGFEKSVMALEAAGGGDEPESGLEALALAMVADWDTSPDSRHVIVLFTDAPAHPLGDPRQRSAHTYPRSVPTSLDGLFGRWASMDDQAKRLLIFAPETYPWTDIADWDRTSFFPSNAGEGLAEWAMGDIVGIIADSL